MNQVWFGTQDNMGWIPAPLANYNSQSVGWRSAGTYLGGGGYSIDSGTMHQEFTLAWGSNNLGEIDKIRRVLLSGNLMYYIDPLAAVNNLLPTYAAQYVYNNPFGFTPAVSTAAVNGYPTTQLFAGKNTNIFTLVVPTGYLLHVGSHGTSGGLIVTTGTSTNTEVPCVPTSNNNRVTRSFGPGKVYVSVKNGSILSGIIAQMLPVGTSPALGGFISGYGLSGLRLKSDPQVTQYSAVIENAQISLSAEFIEAGAWE